MSNQHLEGEQRGFPEPSHESVNQLASAFAQLGEVKATLDMVPEPTRYEQDLVLLEGARLEKKIITHSYDVRLPGGVTITISKEVAGYGVQGDDDIEFRWGPISDQVIEAIANGLAALGEPELRRALDRSKQDPQAYTIFSPIPPEVAAKIKEEQNP